MWVWTVLDAALKKYHSKTVNHIEAIPSYHRVLLSLFFCFFFQTGLSGKKLMQNLSRSPFLI